MVLGVGVVVFMSPWRFGFLGLFLFADLFREGLHDYFPLWYLGLTPKPKESY